VTYNHEKYIQKCLDGFVMQKTNFKFEILVHEDASTDRTSVIVKEYEAKYPDLFRCVYQTVNQFAIQNTLTNILFQMAQGKYIALCEGDDYWPDPTKLQKQVDFLEQNNDFVICGTDAQVLIAETDLIENETMLSSFTRSEFDFEDMSIQNRLITGSVVYRNNPILKNLPTWLRHAPVGDWPLFLILSQFGRVKNLDFVGVVYRKHQGGFYSQLSSYNKNLISIKMYEIIIKEFNITNSKVFKAHKEYIFYAFNSAPSKIAQREMLMKYIRPLRSMNFSNRLFLKMLFRYFFVSTKGAQG
jgi:glycosyltransferase involved in cell wall biosynthesis